MDRFEELLRSVPRQTTSDGFTEAVFTRRSYREARLRSSRRQAVAAVCVLVFALTGGGALYRHHRERQALREVRVEYSRIERELQEIKELTGSYSSVVYLGSTDQEEVVLDLGSSEAANAASISNASNEF